MKTVKFFVGVFTLLLMPNFINAQVQKAPPVIHIAIQFGKRDKVTDECKWGFGLCKFQITDISTEKLAKPLDNNARGTASIVNNKLKIQIDRNSITDASFKKHFGGKDFSIEEDYILPSDIAVALGIKSYTIKAGHYALPKNITKNTTISLTF